MRTQKMMLGAVLVGFLLLFVPAIPAVQYQSVEQTQTHYVQEQVLSLRTGNHPLLTQLKQQIAEESFIDIALILVILNILIVRGINKVSGQLPSTPIKNIMSFLMGISYYLFIIAAEYQTGEVIMPRNTAYRLYFTTLFLIPITIILLQLPSNSLTTKILSFILSFISGILSSILANLLVSVVGTPSPDL